MFRAPPFSTRECPPLRALACVCAALLGACGRFEIGPVDATHLQQDVRADGALEEPVGDGAGPTPDVTDVTDVLDATDPLDVPVPDAAEDSFDVVSFDATETAATDVPAAVDVPPTVDADVQRVDVLDAAPADARPDTAAPMDVALDAPVTPTDAPLDAYDDPIAPDGAMLCRLPAPRANGPGSCAPVAVSDYCAELPALANAPVIDGVLECGLPLQRVRPAGWSGAGMCPPAEYGLRMAVAWRPDGLYLFFDADSDGLRPPGASAPDYCGDGFELEVDNDGVYGRSPNFDTTGTRQFVLPAPVNETTPSRRGTAYRDTVAVAWTGGSFVTQARTGGYSLEMFVRASDLGLTTWALARGGRVGFDGALNVASRAAGGGCESRLGQYFVRVDNSPSSSCGGFPHCNVQAFCRPVLR